MNNINMEFNLQNISFYKGYNLATFIIALLSPSFVFLIIYDYSIFEKLDTLKILLACISGSGFLYITDMLLCTTFIMLMNLITGFEQPKFDKSEVNLDTGSYMAVLFFNISNAVTIFNLVWIRYYAIEKKDLWIKASLQTWLLVQAILFGILGFIFCLGYILNRKQWRLNRASKRFRP